MDASYEANPSSKLSEVDGIILDMITQGATNSEIAQRIHYSTASVKGHIRRLVRSFGARNRVELAAKASQLDIARAEPFAERLTDGEMLFLSRFSKLPSETRVIIAEVALALSEALSGRFGDWYVQATDDAGETTRGVRGGDEMGHP